MRIPSIALSIPLLLTLASPVSRAHVTLPPGGATAGSLYPAAFRVGHACKDASATTSVRVRVPAGFTPVEARPRPGWTVSIAPGEVSWTATGGEAALAGSEKASFVVSGRLTEQPGVLWFKVLQVCDKGSADWAQVPAREGDKPEFPAAMLEVLAPGLAPVDVRDAWARATVPGQTATGVFARLTAGAGSRLLGGSSSVATGVEVHEMRMDGDVMRMRALDQGLELPPAEAVELRPGGHHLMITGLRQPLPEGSTLPVTLNFVDRDGRRGELRLQVPVKGLAGPAAAGAAREHH